MDSKRIGRLFVCWTPNIIMVTNSKAYLLRILTFQSLNLFRPKIKRYWCSRTTRFICCTIKKGGTVRRNQKLDAKRSSSWHFIKELIAHRTLLVHTIIHRHVLWGIRMGLLQNIINNKVYKNVQIIFNCLFKTK